MVLRSDFGSRRPAASVVTRGAIAVAGQARPVPGALVRPALVNGAAGVVITVGGRPFAVMGFTVSEGKIVEIDAIADPERVPGGSLRRFSATNSSTDSASGALSVLSSHMEKRVPGPTGGPLITRAGDAISDSDNSVGRFYEGWRTYNERIVEVVRTSHPKSYRCVRPRPVADLGDCRAHGRDRGCTGCAGSSGSQEPRQRRFRIH